MVLRNPFVITIPLPTRQRLPIGVTNQTYTLNCQTKLLLDLELKSKLLASSLSHNSQSELEVTRLAKLVSPQAWRKMVTINLDFSARRLLKYLKFYKSQILSKISSILNQEFFKDRKKRVRKEKLSSHRRQDVASSGFSSIAANKDLVFANHNNDRIWNDWNFMTYAIRFRWPWLECPTYSKNVSNRDSTLPNEVALRN